MQKELTLTLLHAKFTKSFETFGKMDPFLVFHVSKNQQKRTQTAENSGKQPKWTKPLIVRYMDEAIINVKAFQEDMSTNQFMGEGTINLKTLKEKGQIEVVLIGQENEEIGKVYGEYTVKTLAPAPFLIVKNIVCDFYHEVKFLLKTKPFMRVHCHNDSIDFQTKKQTDAKILHWNQSQRIKIKDVNKIQFKLLDADDQNAQIFTYQAPIKDFRTLSGTKKFNVNDKKYNPFGVLSFDYETMNFVNKEDSIRNEEKLQAEEGSLKLITINKIKGQFDQSGNDIYMKILIGPNKLKTNEIPNAEKKFESQINGKLYAEAKQHKITFAIFDKDFIKDDLIGVGFLGLQGVANGQKTIDIYSSQKKKIGLLKIDLTCSKVIAKTICLTSIKLKAENSSDIIGDSDSFVVSRIGGWTARTQTKTGKQIQFKKPLVLNYSNEEILELTIFDEDLTQNQKALEGSTNLKQLQNKKKGLIKVPLKSTNTKKNGGQITFQYEIHVGEKNKNKSLKSSTKNLQQSMIIKKEPAKKDNLRTSNIGESAKLENSISNQSSIKNISMMKKSESQKKLQYQSLDVKKAEKKGLQQSYSQRTIQGSRSIKLPSIYDKHYGNEIYDNASAATLQKSVHAYSMPKAQRFRDRPKYNGIEPSYYVQSGFKKNPLKGPHIGFGSKRIIPDHIMKNMKENPSPNAYGTLQKNLLDKHKGKTFGVSRECYEKVVVIKEKNFSKQSLKKL